MVSSIYLNSYLKSVRVWSKVSLTLTLVRDSVLKTFGNINGIRVILDSMNKLHIRVSTLLIIKYCCSWGNKASIFIISVISSCCRTNTIHLRLPIIYSKISSPSWMLRIIRIIRINSIKTNYLKIITRIKVHRIFRILKSPISYKQTNLLVLVINKYNLLKIIVIIKFLFLNKILSFKIICSYK